jgi:hypothetical protein
MKGVFKKLTRVSTNLQNICSDENWMQLLCMLADTFYTLDKRDLKS